jgi:hypothetical protein
MPTEITMMTRRLRSITISPFVTWKALQSRLNGRARFPAAPSRIYLDHDTRCRRVMLFKPLVYRFDEFVDPANIDEYEKQHDTNDCSYCKCFSYRIHVLSPLWLER